MPVAHDFAPFQTGKGLAPTKYGLSFLGRASQQ